MEKPYRKAKIFDKNEISLIYDIWSSSKTQWVSQFYNVWYMERANSRVDYKINWVSDKIKNFLGGNMTLSTYYFLRYLPGSYTTLHRDAPDAASGATVITLIDDVNLIGGNTIIYEKIKTPTELEFKHGDFRGKEWWKEDDPFQIPLVVQDLKCGESLIYDHTIKHGVSKVEQGERLVLVTWFKKNEVKND